MPTADSAASPARLDEFVALNSELAALVRGGLPLELGLGAGGTTRLRGVSERVSERLRRGMPLPDAVAEESDLPDAYRAVLEAGLRSGRLAAAVETVARTAALSADLRRRVRLVSIYPAVLLAFGFLILTVILPRAVYSFAATETDIGITPPGWLRTLSWLLWENPTGWMFWLPAAVLLLLWLCGGLSGLAMRLPGGRAAVRSSRLAAFAELAAGLLDQGVPADEAFRLAGEASGDPRLAADARTAADRVRAGQPAGEAVAAFGSIPTFPRWMIAAGAAGGTLPASLRQVADWSARRARNKADWFRLVAPAAVTVAVGVVVCGVCAAALFAPVLDLFRVLVIEPHH